MTYELDLSKVAKQLNLSSEQVNALKKLFSDELSTTQKFQLKLQTALLLAQNTSLIFPEGVNQLLTNFCLYLMIYT